MPVVQVLEYLDSRGKSSYAAWFDNLNANAAAKVAAALYRLEAGNFSNVKGVGAGVFERRMDMALTRDFKKTIAARARRDSRFREALFTEALNSYLAGNTAEGKAILRDLVNATVGFEGLAAEVHKPSKSLHRMLAPRGNPSTDNFFSIVSALQKKTHVKLRVTAGYADSRTALDRLNDKDDPIISSADLKRRLARKNRVY